MWVCTSNKKSITYSSKVIVIIKLKQTDKQRRQKPYAGGHSKRGIKL